jgi:hypothetical protein
MIVGLLDCEGDGHFVLITLFHRGIQYDNYCETLSPLTIENDFFAAKNATMTDEAASI